jgi:NADH-quinone oxidoreductase subunit G
VTQADVTPPDDGRVEVTIDGRTLRVPKGTLVLDAAAEVGIHIPIYCAHPKMDPVAVCRMCLVQVEKMPKLQPACATYVNDGMVVNTATDQVAKVREGVLEFLLLNHPLDCPVCDRGGECDLQDFAFRYGPPTSRMPITDKVHFDKAVPLSDRIELDQERCILCWRCVRYYEEITGEKEIVLQQRGVHTTVATFDGRPLRSAFQGNLPEVCPVGALTHRQYRFVARPWDLQRARSVCPECSYGCNINIDSREYEVKRFASRDNPLVDDMWLCDRGRYSAPRWNRTDRVRRPLVRAAGGEQEVSPPAAVHEAALRLLEVRNRHGANAIGVLGSAECTNEEAWLLQRLAREALGTIHIDHQLGAFPGLSPEEHALGIAEIEDCATVVVLGPRPEQEAPVLTLRLHKAQRRRGTVVHRLPAGVDPAALRGIGGGGLVGVVADETDRADAAHVASVLAAAGGEVRRLTVTRGVNGRGCKDLGLLPNLMPGYRPAPGAGRCGAEILDAAVAGQIRALVVMGSQAWAAAAGAALIGALDAVDLVVALETQPGPVSQAATVLIPGHSHVEKLGSVTNMEGRVQRIRPALPPATSVPTELRILSMLAAELGFPRWPSEAVAVSRDLAAALPAHGEAGNGGRVRWPAAMAGEVPRPLGASAPAGET